MHRKLLFAGIAGLTLSSCVRSAQEPSAVLPAQEPPAWSSPEAAGLDPVALRRLVEGGKASSSDALVVVKNGRIVLEEYFGTLDGPIEAMSATKSVVGLAVGLLLDESRLKSVDQAVSDFYPEWRQGRKAQVTLRHLLNHTSGLGNVPVINDANSDTSDWVKVALAADLISEPGSAWAYNNKAVNLIAGIVKVASGQRMDEYLRDRLLSPLGIKDYRWRLDKAGNPIGMAGLQIRPRDLARIGEMLAGGGLWRGKRILSSAWIETSTLKDGQELNLRNGLLWWLIGGRSEVAGPIIDEVGLANLRKAGVDSTFIERAATLNGRRPKTEGEAIELVQKVFGPEGIKLWMREVIGRGIWPKNRCISSPTSFMARGYLGQHLWVSPKEKLVVVRMHRATMKDYRLPETNPAEFYDFVTLAEALLGSPAPASNVTDRR
jgi:CubicO group peptidase (beta-lactamase class C family)